LAREVGGSPLDWLMLPLEVFLYNWTCVELSLQAEADAIEAAKKESGSSSGGKQANFEDWMKDVAKENAASVKEHKYGIKRRKK
jgi:hypothetical protein